MWRCVPRYDKIRLFVYIDLSDFIYELYNACIIGAQPFGLFLFTHCSCYIIDSAYSDENVYCNVNVRNCLSTYLTKE